MMKLTVSRVILGLAGSCLMAVPVVAHHSFAMFDQSKLVEYKGTVTEFHWINPHAHIILEVEPGPGVDPKIVGEYDIECAAPNTMRLQGWSSTTVKMGDKVTIIGNPLRDNAKGGSLFYVLRADGTRIYRDIARPKPNGPKVNPLGAS
jgi:uncharacterized protein DUF6152